MSTMESSTRSPMATAIPPSVIVLIEIPNQRKISTVSRIEIGMAVSELMLVRKFHMKMNSTTTTQIAPSRMASTTFSTAASMKSACLKIRCSMTIPSGKSSCSSPSTVPICRSSFRVSALGCFWTARMTADPPSILSPSRTNTLPSPRLTGPPNRTSATSFNSTAR